MSSKPTEFVTCTLSDCDRERRDLLCGVVTTTEWWQTIMDDGCFVAGGAALFITDPVQCLKDVGDVDIWLPPDCHDNLVAYVTVLYEWLRANDFAVRITCKPSVVTVWNALMPIQFIKVVKADPRAVLVNFDMDCVQCAVTKNERILSEACVAAHDTRVISWRNERKWKFQRLKPAEREQAIQRRDEYRVHKMMTKKFCFADPRNLTSAETFSTHTCSKEHRQPDTMFLRVGSNVPEYDLLNDECMQALRRVRKYRQNRVWTQAELVQMYGTDEWGENTRSWTNVAASSPTSSPTVKRKSSGEAMQAGAAGAASADASAKRGKTEADSEREHDLDEHEWAEVIPVREPFTRDSFRALRTKYALAAAADSDSNKTQRYWYGVRNLNMLQDMRVPLRDVQLSVRSDALKCGANAEGSGMAMLFSALVPSTDIDKAQQLLLDIKQYFFND